MPEPPRRYPLVRYRRRRWQPRRPADPRRFAAAAILVVLAVLAGYAATRKPPADPRRALVQALAAARDGRWTAARDAALAAGDTGRAQIVLARAYLELGDGVAGEAAVSRALAASVAPARLHHLRAQAWLLQGDEDGALAEVARAGPAYGGYAARIAARAIAQGGEAARAQQVLLASLARRPGDAAAWTDLGTLRLSGGDIGGASEAASRAVATGRRDPAALVLEGEVVRSRYGPVAALPWFDAALARDPALHAALIERAATLGEVGRYREMLATARQAAAVRPGSAQALYLQAVLAARAGRVALARALLAHAGDALAEVPGALLLGSALDLAGGAPELAANKARQLLDVQPFNLPARRLLAAALLRTGDAVGTLKLLSPLLARGDADAYSLELGARAARITGDAEGAARLHDRAQAGDPAAPAPFASDAAIATLQAEVASRPRDPAAMLALVRGLSTAGGRGQATAAAGHLAAVSPGVPAAQVALGDARLVEGDIAKAATAFARGANLRFDEPGMLRLVDAYGRLGRGADAAGVLATYLSQNPDSVLALRLIGHWQVAARQWPAAIRSLERVRRRLGGRDAAVLADLALAHAGAGDAVRARQAGAAAYRLAPGNLLVVRAYAAALAAAGDGTGARQLADKAAALAR